MKYLIILFSAISLLVSCVDKERVEAPYFEVTTDKEVYKVNEEVKFHLKGNPDYLTFFSGEPMQYDPVQNKDITTGYRYDYIERTSEPGLPILTFNSRRSVGNQENTLSLMVSSDFNGIMDYENVTKANWTDLSSLVNWPIGENTNNVASGAIDLSDFKNKPIHIAFKYVGYAGSAQRRWDLSSVVLTNTVKTDSLPYRIWQNGLSPRFKSVFLSDSTNVGWNAPGTTLTVQGHTAQPYLYNEHWLVSSLVDVTAIQPDVGVQVKSQGSNVPDFYSYQYRIPGTYKVTFIAKNATISDAKEVRKDVILTVEP